MILNKDGLSANDILYNIYIVITNTVAGKLN